MKKIFLFILCTIPVWIACSDEEFDIPSDPQEAILGKWKVIESGTENGLKKVSSDYVTEYFADGTYKTYDRSLDEGNPDYTFTYQIDSDSFRTNLLVKGEDPSNDNEHVYKYRFYKNKLRLEYVSGNIPDIMGYPTIHIYKRID